MRERRKVRKRRVKRNRSDDWIDVVVKIVNYKNPK